MPSEEETMIFTRVATWILPPKGFKNPANVH